MGELISVIVPVYNVEAYLEKCVTSIINQTYREIEIILIDDGSTDSSGILCDKLARQDTRIRVNHKKNGGLSEARNYGIDMARGEYLSFIDSDDYIESSMLQMLIYNLHKYNADISVCAYKMEYPNKSVDIKEGHVVRIYSKDQAFQVLLHKNNIGVISWNKLYKSNLFQDIRYPVGQHFEDINTTYKLIAKTNKVVYMPKVFYHYVQRVNSINGVNFKKINFNKKLYDMEFATDELLRYVEKNCTEVKQEVSIGCCDYYLRIINQEILFGIDNINLRNKARKLIIKNRKKIISARYLTTRKKIQMLLYGYMPDIYKFIVKKVKGCQ